MKWGGERPGNSQGVRSLGGGKLGKIASCARSMKLNWWCSYDRKRDSTVPKTAHGNVCGYTHSVDESRMNFDKGEQQVSKGYFWHDAICTTPMEKTKTTGQNIDQWFSRGRRGHEWLVMKGHGEIGREMKLFYILIVVMVAWLVKVHETAHQKEYTLLNLNYKSSF